MKLGAKKSALILATLIAAATFALPACTNNATPVEAKSENAASVTCSAYPTKGNPLEAKVDSPMWRLPWSPLTKAMQENKSLPDTRIACLYDANNLYVAFAGVESNNTNVVSEVSVWLDCSAKQNGTELIEIKTNAVDVSKGFITVMRHRSVKAAEVRDTPDFSMPMDHIQESTNFLKIARGKTVLGAGEDRKEAWSVVMAIPFKALHFPPNFTPTAGFNWRFNLLRTDTVPGSSEVVQANLSPVHAGAQQVMPYRMATMSLAKTTAVGAAPVAPVKPIRVAVSK